MASYFKQTLNLRWKQQQKALGWHFQKGKGRVKGNDKGKADGSKDWQQYQPDETATDDKKHVEYNWQTAHNSHDAKWATDDKPENVGHNLTSHNSHDAEWSDTSSPGACASTADQPSAELYDPVLIDALQEPGQPQLNLQEIIARQAQILARISIVHEVLDKLEVEAIEQIAPANSATAQQIASAGDALAEAAAPVTHAAAPKAPALPTAAELPAELTATPEAPAETLLQQSSPQSPPQPQKR